MIPETLAGPKQGSVYEFESQDEGRHYFVVISKDRVNRGRTLLVVPFTSTRFHERTSSDTCAAFNPGCYSFLTKDCVVHCEAMKQIRVDSRDKPIGQLSPSDLNRVLEAVGNVFGLNHFWDEVD